MKGIKRAMAIILGVFIAVFSVGTPISAANAVSKSENVSVNGMMVRTYKKTHALANNSSGGFDEIYLPKNEKFYVIGEENGYFLLSVAADMSTWVLTTDVLVNVKDYIPNIDVRLDMAWEKNLFSMGGETITGLTNRQFYTSEGSEDGSECWLMYKTAQKLLKAHNAFNKDGYEIVIFDAYRPYSTSMEFKDAYSNWLDNKSVTFKNKWFGELGESWFIAQKANSHNYGVAVDMTLKNLNTGEILDMPTEMHTLDIRSAYSRWGTGKNIEARNGRYMKQTMESAGFNYLKSEWWHFQLPKSEWTEVIDIPN